MKPKAKIKIAIDALMTLTLLFLMGYQFWGDEAHEWVGAGMLILFVLHQILNIGWYRNLFHGQYTPMRVVRLLINIALFAAVLMQMYSGIVMSRHTFAFLQLDGSMLLARRLHILGAYWGFVLMSLHLGIHWNMFLGMAKKALKGKTGKYASAGSAAGGVLIAVYGGDAFIKRNLLTYMLLQTEFVLMDFSESKLLFYLDYLAMMGLFLFLTHSVSNLFRKFPGKKKEGKAG